MSSPQQEQDSKQRQTQAETVKLSYETAKGTPMMVDLLEHLETLRAASYYLASNETDNSTKALAHLQKATAYHTIKAYIEQKMY